MKRRVPLLPLVIGLAWGALAAASEALPPLEADRRVIHAHGVQEVTFTNGLTLLCKENRAAPVVATRVFVRMGSIYEGERLGSGVSHYFEHVIHGGTTSTRTEAESRALLERIGNDSNAYTSRDATVYFITTDAEHFPVAAGLLGDFMANCLLDEKEFLRERGVILQEIRKNLDTPERAVQELLDETMFPGHPAGQPVIGRLPLFQAVTREDVARLYRRYYVANNMVVAVVGAVDAKTAEETVARAFAGCPRGVPNHPPMPPVPRQTSTRWAERASPKIRKTYLAMGHHTVTLDHPDLFALDLTADILGKGRTSRLYRALREKGLVQEISAYSYTPMYNAGVFGVDASFPEENRAAVLTAALEELNRLKTEPVSQEELDRAVKNKITDEVFQRETMERQTSDIGYNYLLLHDPNFTDRYLDGIRRVRPEDILRVARQYLTDENRTVALLYPAPAESPAGREAEDRTQEVAAAPVAAETRAPSPSVEKIALENGARILYGFDPNVQSVLIQATFLGGVLSETEEDNGISQLMATLLLQGTEKRSKEKLHRDVEDLGARLWSRSGNNSWYVGLKLLPEDFEKGMATLAEVVRTPRFAEEDFTRERMLQFRRLESLADSWEEEAGRLFRETYFGSHPYARIPLGTRESLPRLTVEAVKAYHARVLNPQACVLAVFGNVSRDLAVEAAQAHFGTMGGPGRAYWTYSPLAHTAPTGTTAAKSNSKDQVVLTYGFPGEPFGSADLPAFLVLDTILSGYTYPSGRLHEALRGEADLVYLVHAYNWEGLGTGVLRILTQTSPENVEPVLRTIDGVLSRAQSGDFSPEEVERAKETVVIADVLEEESLEARATQASYDELYGVGYDFHQGFAGRIRAVTLADVKRSARAHLSSRPVLCATGPAEALERVKEKAVP
ncbi:MAG: pitrilysin family protein [Planctomycetota bacterium]